MATLSRWDPLSEMQRLTDQMFRGFGAEAGPRTFAPAVDIYEDGEAIYVKAELPGVTVDEIQIGVDNNVLTISGERRLEREDNREGYHRIERTYGTFTRSFVLPETADTELVEADVNDGVLTVKIPKKAEVAHKRIEVKSKGGKGEGQLPSGSASAGSPSSMIGQTPMPAESSSASQNRPQPAQSQQDRPQQAEAQKK